MASPIPLTLHVAPTGDLLAATRSCETDVFLSAYGNTTDEWDDEYGPYEANSVFLSLTDPAGDVVGFSRLIAPNADGLKSLDDLARAPWQVDGYRSARAAGIDLNATLDIATVGIRKGMKSGGALASIAMYHGIVMLTRANYLPDIVMIMDERARRLLMSIGCITGSLPGTKAGPYLGSSASTPLWANVPRMMTGQRRVNPDGYRLVSQGIGLESIAIPTPAQFVLAGHSPHLGAGADLRKAS